MRRVARPALGSRLEPRGTATRMVGAVLRLPPALAARRGTPYPACVMREALTTLDTEAIELIASSNGKYVTSILNIS